MGERFVPTPGGEQKPAREKDVKKFVRTSLTSVEKSPAETSAAVEFATAAFYVHQGIGDPQYHITRAIRYSSKLGLSPEDVERARQLGNDMFAVFTGEKALSEISPEAVLLAQQAMETEVRQRAQKAENRRDQEVGSKKARLKNKFKSLQDLSDTELKISTSNSRIAFAKNSVYASADGNTRARFRNRTLTKGEYDALDTISLAPQDAINITRLIQTLHESKEVDQSRERLGEERFSVLYAFVERVLKGDIVPKTDIVNAGLDPENVLSRAMSARYNFTARKAAETRVLRRKIRLSEPVTWTEHN